MLNGFKEYNSLQKQSAQSVIERASINAQPNSLRFEEQAEPVSYPTISDNIDNTMKHTVVPQMEKQAIGGVMNVFGALGANDANMFWKIATDDVNGYRDYVEQNGVFVDSISNLPFDFKDTVRAKVKQQLGVDDLRGLVLRPDSSLSRKIAHSEIFNQFLKLHCKELINGHTVSGSVAFPTKTNFNLQKTFGKADILDTYINKNGDIVSFVLDTYDFNKGESLPIEIARNVQEHGLLNGFYSITILLVPKEQWLGWLFNK